MAVSQIKWQNIVILTGVEFHPGSNSHYLWNVHNIAHETPVPAKHKTEALPVSLGELLLRFLCVAALTKSSLLVCLQGALLGGRLYSKNGNLYFKLRKTKQRTNVSVPDWMCMLCSHLKQSFLQLSNGEKPETLASGNVFYVEGTLILWC